MIFNGKTYYVPDNRWVDRIKEHSTAQETVFALGAIAASPLEFTTQALANLMWHDSEIRISQIVHELIRLGAIEETKSEDDAPKQPPEEWQFRACLNCGKVVSVQMDTPRWMNVVACARCYGSETIVDTRTRDEPAAPKRKYTGSIVSGPGHQAKACGECKYIHRDSGACECRRWAPQVDKRNSGEDRLVGEWPAVGGLDWCGEFSE